MKSKTKPAAAAKKQATKPAPAPAAAKKTAAPQPAKAAAKKTAAKKAAKRGKPEEPTVEIATGIVVGFRGYTSTEGIPKEELVFEKGDRLIVIGQAKIDGKPQKGQWECKREDDETIVGVVLAEELRVLKQPKPEEPLPVVENTDAVKKLLKTHDSTAAAEELVKDMERNEFTLGGVIHEIRLHKAHERIVDAKGKQVYSGAEGFAQYCEDRLKMHWRKAYGLADIYVVARQVGITEEDVGNVGWTKMQEIVRVVTPKNRDRLVKFAGGHTVPELKEFIVTLKEKGDVSERGAGAQRRGAGRSTTHFGFSVPGDRAEFIKQALTIAKDAIREDGKEDPSDSEAFAALCSEFLSLREAADMSREAAVEAFTARFPSAEITFKSRGK